MKTARPELVNNLSLIHGPSASRRAPATSGRTAVSNGASTAVHGFCSGFFWVVEPITTRAKEGIFGGCGGGASLAAAQFVLSSASLARSNIRIARASPRSRRGGRRDVTPTLHDPRRVRVPSLSIPEMRCSPPLKPLLALSAANRSCLVATASAGSSRRAALSSVRGPLECS